MANGAAETQETFADGIGHVSYSGGVVRIDYVSQSSTERDAAGKPVLVHRHRVIMPLEAFVAAFATQRELVEKLVKQGAVKASNAPRE